MDEPIARGVFRQPDCNNCPLRYETKVPPEGDPHAQVMLVGEAPGKEEIYRGRPFVGRSGIVLDVLLKRLGFSRAQVWISNTALCLPRPIARSVQVPCPMCHAARGRHRKTAAAEVPCSWCNSTGATEGETMLSDKQVLAEAVVFCRRRLLAEVETIQPRTIVPLGRFALEAFIGRSSGILKHRGAVHRVSLPAEAFQ